MKNKFIKITPLVGISALILAPIIDLSINQVQSEITFEVNNLVTTKNQAFDLATQPLLSGVLKYTPSLYYKETITPSQIETFYTDHIQNTLGPLSQHSINTVRTTNYLFNFITNKEGYIRIIGTPTSANGSSNILEFTTKYKSVGDSALFINKQLIVIGDATYDIGDTNKTGKWLSIYEINEKNPGFIQGQVASFIPQLEIVEVAKVKLPTINITTESKFALSPITTPLMISNISEFVLWPVGITIDELKSKRGEVFKRITIEKNQAPVISDLPISFSTDELSLITFGDQILSLTPIEISGTNGITKLKFFANSVPPTRNGVVQLLEFFPEGSELTTTIGKTIYDFAAGDPNAKWAPPALGAIVPYAFVQQNNIGFSLFWIAQNGEKPAETYPLVPSVLTRVNISIANNSFSEILLENTGAIELGFPDATPQVGNIFKNNGVIEQIHYGVGGNLETGSYISIRNKGSWNTSSNPTDWNTQISAIQLKDGNLNGTAKFPTPTEFSKNLSMKTLNASKSSGPTNNINIMGTVYNGEMLFTGIDPFVIDSAGAVIPETKENSAPMINSRFTVDLSRYDWNSSQISKIIILPSEKSSGDPYFDVPVKISELDFAQLLPGIPPVNHVIRHARLFINDINSTMFNIGGDKFRMNIGTSITYRDINNNVVAEAETATSAEFFVTIPRPFVNGTIVSMAPVTFDFLVMNNPNIEKFSPVTFNTGINIQPSVAATLINSFNNTRVIPANQNIIGTSGAELISIDSTYLDLSLANIDATSDDLLGTLKGSINFIDPNGKILNVPFNISGLEASVILIPSIIVPIVVIALIVLIIVIVLHKKNILNSRKSKKAGYILAQKLTVLHKKPSFGNSKSKNDVTNAPTPGNPPRNLGQKVPNPGNPPRNLGQKSPTTSTPFKSNK